MNDMDLAVAVVLTTLVIVILIALVIIVIFMVNSQRVKQQVELANTRLSYEKELRQVEVEVSEHMMEKFAQELHDNIAHILTCMRMQIENGKLDDPSLEKVFSPIEVHLNDASRELRLLSRSLNTEYISNIGLAAAISLEVERLTQLRRMNIHFTPGNEHTDLDRNQQLMTFRIFQEMVHNAMRHAKAKNFYITIGEENGFRLTVKDDGLGFKLEETLRSTRASGLNNILKRARLAGLVCHIESAPGAGCSYVIEKLAQQTG